MSNEVEKLILILVVGLSFGFIFGVAYPNCPSCESETITETKYIETKTPCLDYEIYTDCHEECKDKDCIVRSIYCTTWSAEREIMFKKSECKYIVDLSSYPIAYNVTTKWNRHYWIDKDGTLWLNTNAMKIDNNTILVDLIFENVSEVIQ